MSMEFSAEDFINGGMGIKPNTSYTVKSSEGYDGFADGLSMELYRADQELQSLEAFETLSDFNVSQKIKMVKRIANNYVGSIQNSVASNSIESVCLAQIKSLEDAAGAPAGDAKTEESPKTTEKKQGFLKTVFGAIARFFEMIWKAITTAIAKFSGWVKNLFAKKNKEASKTDETSDLTNNNGIQSDNKSNLAKNKTVELNKGIDKAKMVFDFTGSFNPAGVTKFMDMYKALSTKIDDVWKARKNAIGKNKDTSNVAHADNTQFTDTLAKDIVSKTTDITKIFGVSANVSISGTKSSDVKKWLDGVAKDIRMASNRNDGIGKLVDNLFGFKAMDHAKLEAMIKSNATKDRVDRASGPIVLQRMSDSLDKFYNSKFIPTMENPHKRLVQLTKEIQADLNKRFDNSANINDTTKYMATIQASLKTCCALEQCVGKVVANVNSNITYQINLMK